MDKLPNCPRQYRQLWPSTRGVWVLNWLALMDKLPNCPRQYVAFYKGSVSVKLTSQASAAFYTRSVGFNKLACLDGQAAELAQAVQTNVTFLHRECGFLN